MANLALALDEIIQQDKKKGIGGRGGGGIRRPRAAGLEAAGGVKTSARTRFPQRGFVSGVGQNIQIYIYSEPRVTKNLFQLSFSVLKRLK